MAGVDWWDSAGRVVWDDRDPPEREELERAFITARELKVDQQLMLAGQPVCVKPQGMGVGTQPRLTYRLEFRNGVTLGLAIRPASKRNVYNFNLKIPGSACLLWGWEEIRQHAQATLDALGGWLEDEWVRRIDLFLDVQRLDLRESLLPAFLEERFVTSAHHWNPWSGRGGSTGFSIGRGGRVVLNVYDKLLEATRRQTPDYLVGMIQRRWGGGIPTAATRIEYQIRKPWLDQHNFRTAEQVTESLPLIVKLLTSDESRPFFRLTQSEVDRENKHQSRSVTLPLWARLMSEFQEQLGIPGEKPAPLQRGGMNLRRDYGIIRGMLTKVAALKGEGCLSLEDAVDVLRKLDSQCNGTQEEWERCWSEKALRFGTLEQVLSFVPF